MATQQGQEGAAKSEQQSGRGFASMDETKQREIASKGGSVVRQDTKHMAEIGRKGAETRAVKIQGKSSDITTTSSSEENMDTEGPNHLSAP